MNYVKYLFYFRESVLFLGKKNLYQIQISRRSQQNAHIFSMIYKQVKLNDVTYSVNLKSQMLEVLTLPPSIATNQS